jgi:hypothetical protein
MNLMIPEPEIADGADTHHPMVSSHVVDNGYRLVNVQAQRDNSAVDRNEHEPARGDVVLRLDNLLPYLQPIELDLQPWNGYTPVELTGRVELHRVGQLPHLLSPPELGLNRSQLCANEETQ